MADDHASAPRPQVTLNTAEEPVHRPIPERLRYPATPEAYAAAVAEARAEVKVGHVISADRVRAWVLSLGSDAPLPPPECD